MLFLESSELKKKARSYHDNAAYLFRVTYASVKDEKLLLGVINNVVSSMENAIDAILSFEKEKLKSPVTNGSMNYKLSFLANRSFFSEKIPAGTVPLMIKLKEIQSFNDNCPVDFHRKGRFVMCDDKYKMMTVGERDVSEFLSKNKEFLDLVVKITN